MATDLEAEQASNESVDSMTNKVLTEFDGLKTSCKITPADLTLIYIRLPALYILTLWARIIF
jgi:hypothetical protein